MALELEEFLTTDGLSSGAIVASIAAAILLNVATTLIGLLWKRLNIKKIERARFAFVSSFWVRYLSLAGAAAGVSGIVTSYALPDAKPVALTLGIILSVLIVLAFHAIRRDRSFRAIGLVRPEGSVANGTGYSRSLQLCTASMNFLGTGAYKLTSSPEFEKAAERCYRSQGSMRLLISRPDVAPLRRAEETAQVDPGDYSTKVRASLKAVRTLVRDRHFPIEVRFYNNDRAKRMQEFRMLFVDEQFLLLSYNKYGEGDGSSTPQLLIRKNERGSAETGFYRPFANSFERMWEKGARWNLEDYLG